MKKIFTFLLAIVASIGMSHAAEGAHCGTFTINSNGDQIVFSKGNLQASTTDFGEHWIWSFATNQWDYIGNAAANNAINDNGTVSVNGIVDLFGWSTSATYYGINNSQEDVTYSGEFVDWGANTISNGNNSANLWRTLTYAEWNYIINTRDNHDNLHGQAVVNGVNGHVFLPDGLDPLTFNFISSPNNGTINQYMGENWSVLEEAGAVFLPCAGWRHGTNVPDVGSFGSYWSSTPDGESNSSDVYCLEIYSTGGYYWRSDDRDNCHSVRLVKTAPKNETTFSNTPVDTKVGKRIVNGQILILRGDRTYTLTGAEVK